MGEYRCFIVWSGWLGISLPGELRGDSSWKNKEIFNWVYLLCTVFLLPILKIYFPHFLGGLCIITIVCMQRMYIPALTESMPFAINGNLNYLWFLLPGRIFHKNSFFTSLQAVLNLYQRALSSCSSPKRALRLASRFSCRQLRKPGEGLCWGLAPVANGSRPVNGSRRTH